MTKINNHFLILATLTLFSYSSGVCSSGALRNETASAPIQDMADVKLTSSEIRTYRPGDTIHYRSTIAGTGAALSGKLQQTISNTITNPYGIPCMEHTLTTSYSGVGDPLPLSVRLLYYQDAQHSLYECGHFDNKTAAYVFISDSASTPGGVALAIASPMQIGNSTSSLISYTDGTWKDCTRRVQAIEKVTTGAGIYEAYKMTESCNNNADNSKTDSVSWFVPSLYIVKESGVGEFIAGDFVLDSYVLETAQ